MYSCKIHGSCCLYVLTMPDSNYPLIFRFKYIHLLIVLLLILQRSHVEVLWADSQLKTMHCVGYQGKVSKQSYVISVLQYSML